MYRLQIHPFLNKHKVTKSFWIHNAVQNTEWCPYPFTSIIYFNYSFLVIAGKALAIFLWFLLIYPAKRKDQSIKFEIPPVVMITVLNSVHGTL